MVGRPLAVTWLSGYVTAVPTPFRDDRIDEPAFTAFCRWQIAEGIAGLVVCGTTGEAPTLAPDEQRRLVALAVDTARSRVPVIAGAGSNSTAAAIGLAQAAEAEGADGLLAVVPYYNRPSQEGLYRHFAAIHDAVGVPILLYDVPSRTGCGLALDTIVRLAALPRIAGLKDATGDIARLAALRQRCGERFRLFGGDDATALGFLALGGHGIISVTSNIVPALCGGMAWAWRRGAVDEAAAIAARLQPLTAALFAETNPVPVKAALAAMGRMAADVRLPLCRAEPATERRLAAALAGLAGVPAPAP